MALAKRGSRPIHVDGEQYYWYVRHKPTYTQWHFESTLSVAVEFAMPNSSILLVYLPQFHPGHNETHESNPAVLPSDVAQYIREARSAGWTPTGRKRFLWRP